MHACGLSRTPRSWNSKIPPRFALGVPVTLCSTITHYFKKTSYLIKLLTDITAIFYNRKSQKPDESSAIDYKRLLAREIML